MSTYVIDAPAAIELVSRGFTDPGEHRLIAPALIRSQVLSLLQQSVAAGRLDRAEARAHFEAVNALPARLLGDARLRRTAWKLADSLGWTGTFEAEYVALTQLHADALVTGDVKLAQAVDGVVDVVSVDSLLRPSDRR